MSAETAPPAPTTVERAIIAGAVRGRGRKGVYRGLAWGPGERLLLHGESQAASALGPGSRSLLRLVHLTDFQLADVQSPGRFEFFQEVYGRPGSEAFVPAQRAQEAMATHAIEMMAVTIRRLGDSPDTGAPLGLALCTGDNIDNAQLNELTNYLALLGGGEVAPGSGGAAFEGVQAAGWPNPLFWHPDPGSDTFKDDWGFPEHPGLLDQAMRSFGASGVGVPWLSCFGNHDGLALGTALPTPEYRAILLGDRKALALPEGPDLIGREVELITHPEHFHSGPPRQVTPDPSRRMVGRAEYLAAHLGAPGLPIGHGFSQSNVEAGTAYASYDDQPEVRLLLLDTTNMDGYHEGSIGRNQMQWLEQRLVEVHSRFRRPDGTWVTTNNQDVLVVLASHHGPATLTNDRQEPAGMEDDHPRATAKEVLALVHRFPNAVLWLNGHRHLNEVVLWPSPYDPELGIWEVSTASMADWPCQARVVELVVGANGTLSVLCTMLDHAAGLDPDQIEGLERLASLHRQLAANIPGAGLGSVLEGTTNDRNVELTMAMPFRR